MAVPIVTSFAVQTITGLVRIHRSSDTLIDSRQLSTYSARGQLREQFLTEKERNKEAFQPHSDFVLRARETFNDMRQKSGKQGVDVQPLEPDSTEDRNGGYEADDLVAVEDSKAEAKKGRRTENGDEADRNLSNDSDDEWSDDGDTAKEHDGAKSKRKPSQDDDVAEGGTEDDPDDLESTKEDEGSEKTATASTSPEGDQKESRNPSRADKKYGSPGEKEEAHLLGGRDKIKEDFAKIYDHAGKKRNKDGKGDGGDDDGKKEDEDEHQLAVDLIKQLLNRTVQLEAEARQMLLESMPHEIARTLLLADRNGPSPPRRFEKGLKVLLTVNSASARCQGVERGRCEHAGHLAGRRG